MACQKSVLRWFQKRISLGLASDAHIAAWKGYFRTLPSTPTATFVFLESKAADCDRSTNQSDENGRPGHGGKVKEEGKGVAKEMTIGISALRMQIAKDMEGMAVEPITHPGYTRGARKRKRTEREEKLNPTQLDFEIKVSHFGILHVPVEDEDYKLKFCLVKFTSHDPSDNSWRFKWWTYSGYPSHEPASHRGPWVKSILKGKGQR